MNKSYNLKLGRFFTYESTNSLGNSFLTICGEFVQRYFCEKAPEKIKIHVRSTKPKKKGWKKIKVDLSDSQHPLVFIRNPETKKTDKIVDFYQYLVVLS